MCNPTLTELYRIDESDLTVRQATKLLSGWDGGEEFAEVFGEDALSDLTHVLALAADQHGGFPNLNWYDWERALGSWMQDVAQIDPPAGSEEMEILDELIEYLESKNGGQKGGDPREPR